MLLRRSNQIEWSFPESNDQCQLHLIKKYKLKNQFLISHIPDLITSILQLTNDSLKIAKHHQYKALFLIFSIIPFDA